MKIIKFIEPSPSYPLLNKRIEKSIDYVVDYYQKRNQLAHHGISVPKFLFKNTWPSTQYVEDIIKKVSFRTGLTIAKVDKAFSILMERGSIEGISDFMKSEIPKRNYLIYLKALELDQDFFLLEELMKDSNNLVIATARIHLHSQEYNEFELLDIDTLMEEKEEVRSLVTNNIRSTLIFDIEDDVLEKEVRDLLNKSIVTMGNKKVLLNMSLVSQGINKIKKTLYELYN